MKLNSTPNLSYVPFFSPAISCSKGDFNEGRSNKVILKKLANREDVKQSLGSFTEVYAGT